MGISKSRRLYYDVMPSPFGPLWLLADENGLAFVMREKTEPDLEAAILARLGALPQPDERRLNAWRSALNGYFSGRKARFLGPFSFLVGTPFQQKVWRKLLEIPYGTTRSYQWLAAQISGPGASRAVGNACGKNPLPIVLPCHRVIRQDGGLGGYTGGTDIKARLLLIEGISVKPRNQIKEGPF